MKKTICLTIAFSLVFVICVYVHSSEPRFISLPDTLSNKELVRSPEKSAEFIRMIVYEIQAQFPEILPRSNPVTLFKPIGQWLDEFCEEDMKIQLQKIQKVKSGPASKLNLIMICDIHPALELKQTEISKSRQKFVIKKINELKPQIVFAENIGEGFVTWNKLLVDLKKSSNGLINAPEQTLKDNSKLYWWSNFIGSKNMKIFGVEDNKLGMLVTSLFSVFNAQEELGLEDRVECINYLWREKVILANIIATMRAEKKQNAVFVFGEAHQKSFSLLCKEWGVNLRVVK